MSRALSHVVSDRARTEVFAWYTLAGSLATAMGALVAGTITRALEKTSMTPVGTYRVVVVLYALVGVLLAGFIYSAFAYGGSGFARGSVGPAEVNQEFLRCRPVAPRCDQTFQPVALGSFAGGFVVQSFAAYWFYLRFGVNPATLGVILGKCLCWNFRIIGGPTGRALGPD